MTAKNRYSKHLLFLLLILIWSCSQDKVTTTALWTFDEPIGAYPSCVLSDHSENDYPLILGPGGQIVSGKFGNALEPILQPAIKLPKSKSVQFGMIEMEIPAGRTVEPLTWHNANHAALMTSGEKHLRKKVEFAKPAMTDLNLGEFDWTVEFWLQTNKRTNQYGVIFEIGSGPRGENEDITRLSVAKDLNGFIFINKPGQASLFIPSIADYLSENHQQWHHFAFVYDSRSGQLSHFADGKLQGKPVNCQFLKLAGTEEDYMTLGRDGRWEKPVQGRLDELRFSRGQVYTNEFNLPQSFSELTELAKRKVKLKKGLPLLFSGKPEKPINLGSRKHLFVDDVIFDKTDGVSFTVNPPRMAERVIDNIQGSFRKHVNVVEDEDGLLRMYFGVADDYLGVMTSRDGINWKTPDLPNGRHKNHTNVVVQESTAMGVVFIDPNAPAEERWKYVSGFEDRGIFLFTSADGYNFKRRKTAAVPLWPGSQSNTFYDEQQQEYIAYHRADFSRGAGNSTQREFLMTRTKNIDLPWDFKPSTQQEGRDLAKKKKVKDLLPFYLDNGPLTPGGFAFEYPCVFTTDADSDPIDTDIYVPKAMKYPWAPDVYLAFPIVYFHYKKTSPITRMALHAEKYQRGSGPLETQLSVSRDAVNWQRYPRPTYVGIGKHEGRDVVTAYMAHGMVKRSNEIWQYYFGETQYHSAIRNDPAGRGVYRLVQRLDGFVSIDSPYDKEVEITTKPFTFSGNRLQLNIDTDAAGYTQVGLLDENDMPIKGFSVDDCIYINGDFINTEVEWMKNRQELSPGNETDEDELEALADRVIGSTDVSELQGKTVKLVFRMRGSKLYAMQFVKN